MSRLSLHWLALRFRTAMHVQVGMIKLSGFNARAQQDVAQAVKALTKQGASEFTLDVRDNRGGLYQEGAEVAKLFLEGKAVPCKDLRLCCGSCSIVCHHIPVGLTSHLIGLYLT